MYKKLEKIEIGGIELVNIVEEEQDWSERVVLIDGKPADMGIVVLGGDLSGKGFELPNWVDWMVVEDQDGRKVLVPTRSKMSYVPSKGMIQKYRVGDIEFSDADVADVETTECGFVVGGETLGIQERRVGTLRSKAFLLNRRFDWVIAEDAGGALLLIPIRKKEVSNENKKHI